MKDGKCCEITNSDLAIQPDFPDYFMHYILSWHILGKKKKKQQKSPKKPKNPEENKEVLAEFQEQ